MLTQNTPDFLFDVSVVLPLYEHSDLLAHVGHAQCRAEVIEELLAARDAVLRARRRYCCHVVASLGRVVGPAEVLFGLEGKGKEIFFLWLFDICVA